MTNAHYIPPHSRETKQASRPASSRPKRLSANRQRNLVAQTIERLLDLLDAIEPDPEAEPSLGWTDAWDQENRINRLGNKLDLEEQCEDEGADAFTDN
jgi:hypothetical protein